MNAPPRNGFRLICLLLLVVFVQFSLGCTEDVTDGPDFAGFVACGPPVEPPGLNCSEQCGRFRVTPAFVGSDPVRATISSVSDLGFVATTESGDSYEVAIEPYYPSWVWAPRLGDQILLESLTRLPELHYHRVQDASTGAFLLEGGVVDERFGVRNGNVRYGEDIGPSPCDSSLAEISNGDAIFTTGDGILRVPHASTALSQLGTVPVFVATFEATHLLTGEEAILEEHRAHVFIGALR